MTFLNTLQHLSLTSQERLHVEKLFHDGEFISLGRVLSDKGFHELAGDIYQKAFAFEDAFETYHQANAWKKMCTTAFSSADEVLKDKCIVMLLEAQKAEEALSWIPQGATLFRATLLEQMNRHAEAAPLFEAAGHWLSAAQSYEKTNNYSQAGMLYERLLKSNRGDPQINMCYSRILMELGQFSEAIKILQSSLRDTTGAIQHQLFPLLLVCFLALNLKESANTILSRWQDSDDSTETPSHLDLFLRQPLATYYLDRNSSPPEQGGSVILGGRYLLTTPLETTPISEKWTAFDRLSSTTVHIDIFTEKWLSKDSFRHAIQELQAINNQSLIGSVRYLDIKPYQNFLVKKPTTAPTLKQAFTSISWAEMRRQFYRLLDIVENFHNAGWLHTQLNLSNIFWGPRHIEIDGWAYRHLKGNLQTLTSGDDSPWRFCAPEIFHHDIPGTGADIYSLVAILKSYFDRHATTLKLSDLEKSEWNSFWENNLSNNVKQRAADISALRQQIPDWPRNCDSNTLDTAVITPKKVELPHQIRIKLLFENGEYKLFESYHVHLHRPEWIVQFNHRETLERLLPWANMQNGVQPVYRWLSDHDSIIIAPGTERLITIDALKRFPYSLMRDLSAVASALDTLHRTGLGLNGFTIERCLGGYGPQLQLAPGPMPEQLTQQSKHNDVKSFEELVGACFSITEPSTLWTSLLRNLQQQKKISEEMVAAHLQSPQSLSSWSMQLINLSLQLKGEETHHVFTQITNEIQLKRQSE